MFTFSEIVALFSAIGNNAVSLFGGLLGIVFTVLSIWRKDGSQRRIFLGIGLVCLFISPIYAWRDEYRLRVDAENKILQQSPKLVGKILQQFGFEHSLGIDLVVLLSITNVGLVPTTPSGFRLNIRPPRLYEMGPITPSTLFEDHVLQDSTGKVTKFAAKDLLFNKLNAPIAQGGVLSGWLIYEIKGLRFVDVYGGQFTILFRDHMGQQYSSVSPKITGEGKDNLVYPGVDNPNVK